MADKYVVQMSKESGESYLILDKTARAQISAEATAREAAVAAEATAREAAVAAEATAREADITNLKGALSKPLTYQNGYYNETNGAHTSGNTFICSTNAIDTSKLKHIHIQNRMINDIVDVFFTLYENDSFVKNVAYASSYFDLSEIDFIVPGDITKVFVNFHRQQNISPEDGNKIGVFLDNLIPQTNYVIDPLKIKWVNGYIEGSDGSEKNSNRMIRTSTYIPLSAEDTLDVIVKPGVTGKNFYIAGYDRNYNYIKLIQETTQAAVVHGFEGNIRIVIYSETNIAPDDWKNIISIKMSAKDAMESIEMLTDNKNHYLSANDYFESAYDHFDISWKEGFYINETGVTKVFAEACLSGLLRVEPGAYYQTHIQLNEKTDGRISFYNKNYEFIGTEYFESDQMYHKMPDDCEYVRLNFDIQHYKDVIFVRASHINGPKFKMADTRVRISKWFENRFIKESNGVEKRAEGTYLSDFAKVKPSTFYVIPPQSVLYRGEFVGITQFDSEKNWLRTDNTLYHYFVTGPNCEYIRISTSGLQGDIGWFAYIEEQFNKETDAISANWKNGYYRSQDGHYTGGSSFICTTQKIDTSEKKTVDIFKDSNLQLESIFLSLYKDSFVGNVAFASNSEHVHFEVPDEVQKIHINAKGKDSLNPSTDGEMITICVSNHDSKKNFNIVDYVSSEMPDRNYIVQTSSKSNLLPLGLDYNTDDMQEAFTKAEVSEEINNRGLDSPCVFWDSIKCRWGMVFTGYKEDEVSEYGTIYAAHSDDLIHWVQDGPIIERNVDDEYAPDYGTVSGPYAYIEDEKYYIYYIGGNTRGFEAGKTSICLATGTELDSLTKHPSNPLVIGQENGLWYAHNKVYRPSVLKWGDGTYYMFFNARNSANSESGHWHEYLGYAVSSDLVHWNVQGRILEDIAETAYDHCVTGDACFYDIGDDYIYATLYTCFNQTGIDWSKTGVGIMRTTKKNFPVGWKMIKNNMTGAHKNKSYVVYKNGRQYAFMADTYRAILYRIADE